MNYSDVILDYISFGNLEYNEKKDYYQLKPFFNDNDLIFKTSNMKINNINENNITLEFLKNNDKFYDFIFELDKYIIRKIYENSQELFEMDLTLDNINNLFVSNINLPTSLKYYPIINLNVSNSCQVYDKDKSLINVLDLDTNSEIQ